MVNDDDEGPRLIPQGLMTGTEHPQLTHFLSLAAPLRRVEFQAIMQ